MKRWLRLPRKIDRYVARHVLLATLGVWAVLLGFDLVVNLSSELKDVGKGGYTISHAVMYMLFTLPRRLYELFPTVAVIGCLLGLGGLAARSELTAIRATGVSKLQIGLAALLPLALITALMVANIETLGPAGEQRAQELANTKSGQLIMARYSGLWAREGQLFLNARAGGPRTEGDESWIELQDVRLYQFDGDGRLRSLAQAKTAEHRGGKWLLRNVERAHFLPRSVHVENIASERWNTTLDEQSLVATLAKPRYLSMGELRANITYLERNQLDASRFVSTYWGRWFYPLKVVVLILATLPFAFTSLRSGGFGKRLFVGILIGLGYLLAETLFVNLSDVYRFDVRIAYVVPPALLLAICWGWLGRRL
jgi:lipopolysaccharide export system permease protein